ncbi:hypothetical protein [Fusobacterium sp.]|uniref:hypothetical protein n=1 Tax=Fusobacterium sp. TaxID=68766 RepID=UPI002622C9C8|nr:hypothetical protein [Fusobacterium sp.]
MRHLNAQYTDENGGSLICTGFQYIYPDENYFDGFKNSESFIVPEINFDEEKQSFILSSLDFQSIGFINANYEKQTKITAEIDVQTDNFQLCLQSVNIKNLDKEAAIILRSNKIVKNVQLRLMGGDKNTLIGKRCGILFDFPKGSTVKVFTETEGSSISVFGSECGIDFTECDVTIESGICNGDLKSNGIINKMPSAHLISLDLTAEVNGELYNDITVDKVNKTVTINNLNPETDYNINLIVSFEPYIERSKTIKLVTPPLPIYGVRVNESDSNPFTAITYIEDAIGTATATNTGLGGWENKFPFNRVRIVGFKNGQVVKEIKKEDKTKYIDGTTVPADVDVMIEIPKTYWDFTDTENGYELRISEAKFSETSDCYAHKVRGVEKDHIYVGAYLGYSEGGKLRSRSSVTPTVSQTLTQFRQQAQANGNGYQQWNWFTLLLLQNLYLLAYKNLNSQTALGYGYANGNSSSHQTGGTNTKGMIFGETGGKQQVCFLGIEDFYGNIWQWVDGMFHNNSYQVTVTPDNKTFNDNGSGFKNVGKFISSYVSGKISKVAHTNEGGYFPKECNGSDTTYYCDYGYANSGCFARFGGAWDDGLDAGAFGLFGSYSPSNSYSNLGSRLVFLG